MSRNLETIKEPLYFKILEWFLYMLGYALVLISIAYLFKSFYLDNSYYGIYGLLAVIIIYILNKTIKPILFSLTLPITGITLGLFYPFINLFILKLTDWILGSHFELNNIVIALFIAILISIMNTIMEGLIIKPLVRRLYFHE
ncbi:MAG: phage holin family protein [Bacilli bacterium]